jgi:outer membrane protein insertion porin family
MNVKEKPTGNLMLGLGLSSTEGIVLSGSIAQNNFMGSGNNVGIQVNTGKINTVYSFSYTNPYFTKDGVSQGFDVYHRKVDSTRTSVAPYQTASTGGGLRFGFPLNEKESLSFGVGLDTTTITTVTDSPQRYKDFVKTFGETNLTIPVSVNWVSDGKNSFLFPTSGTFQKAGLEVAIPGGDLTFYRASYQLQQYFPLSKTFTLMLNGDIGYAGGYGETTSLPFYKNFYAGGVNTVRGYKAGSLGPKDTNGDSLGGTRRVIGNAEVLWGFPGMEKSLRMGLFFDAGQVYGQGQNISISDLRYSTGISMAWISPIGPLKFSFGQSLNKQEGDKPESFQFQLGTTF